MEASLLLLMVNMSTTCQLNWKDWLTYEKSPSTAVKVGVSIDADTTRVSEVGEVRFD
jgi:hypothetical protein